MKKIVLSVLLLPLGFSPLAHAACGGTQVNIPPVLGIDNNREYGRIWMNYNRDNDTYCTTMTLRGPRENKPTLGRLNHYVCAAGSMPAATAQAPSPARRRRPTRAAATGSARSGSAETTAA